MTVSSTSQLSNLILYSKTSTLNNQFDDISTIKVGKIKIRGLTKLQNVPNDNVLIRQGRPQSSHKKSLQSSKYKSTNDIRVRKVKRNRAKKFIPIHDPYGESVVLMTKSSDQHSCSMKLKINLTAQKGK